MTRTTTYGTETHNTFGGEIFQSDFNTSYEGTRNIAARIASDWRFDEQCRKNYEQRERMKKNA